MQTTVQRWQLNEIDQQLIDSALTEDLGKSFQDLTTDILFADKNFQQQARIISKQAQPIIVCGLPIVRALIARSGAVCILPPHVSDGATLTPGEILLTLEGQAADLLKLERVILNFLQRLSAIATLTARFVGAVKGTPLQILDTRKTTPGLRHLEKYAVHCGGGVNHRLGLYDALMIKDTHVDLLGGMQQALALLPADVAKKFPVIVEVRDQPELETVLKHGRHKVTRVLLDNMTSAQLTACVQMCRGILPTEASGNINLENILMVAQTGVNFASIGALTHSTGNVDLSMQCNL